MAMLAERRERKRYNLVPRGKALYEDGDRFGTRMLEKMGWTKGKGLGANESGEKEFVRVRYKNDSAGLGFEDRNDQWTQHESEFEKLLKKLGGEGENGAGTENINAEEDDSMQGAFGFGFKEDSRHVKTTEFSGESLEEKSKKSRARVHYMKFTRGKDISQYSEKDLANIFGRKQLATYVGENEENCRDSAETSQTPPDDEKEKTASFGVTTIKSETSLNEYFKTKMEAARKKLKINYNGSSTTYDNVGIVDGINPFKEHPEKKKKHNHSVDEILSITEPLKGTEETTETRETKKSKKRKHCDKESSKLEKPVDLEGDEIVSTESTKNNRKAQDIHTHNIDDSIISTNDDSNGKRRKKSKKLNSNCDLDPQTQFPDEVEWNAHEKNNNEINSIEQEKEGKKCEVEVLYNEIPGSVGIHEVSTSNKKSKKAKKQKKDLETDIQDHLSVVKYDKYEDSNEQVTFDKKQRKKRKDQTTDYKQNEMKSEGKTKIAKTTKENCATESVLAKANDVLTLPVQGPNDDMKPELKEQAHQNPLTSSTGAEPFQFPQLSMRVRKRKSLKPPPMQEKEVQQCDVKQTSIEIENTKQLEVEEDESKLTIRKSTVARFCNADINGFPGSNWGDIIGYRLDGRGKIEIVAITRGSNNFIEKNVNYTLFDNTTKNTIRPSAFEEENAKHKDTMVFISRLKKKRVNRSAFPVVI